MAKFLIEIEMKELPKSCSECSLHQEDDRFQQWCAITDCGSLDYYERRPDWCPLKEIK